ncbi:MAG: ATP-binding protein [Candidatus Omnitrophica bacterium]|nr:ATP-binding protein [Candidatus Omnitrophota bacterium]
MGETKVNLKHLLEDIQDNYPFTSEEAILTELVANSLDSGSSKIQFTIRPEEKILYIVDNGKGMNEKEFEQYHDIATTTKIRGKGIGFAGVGAKIALLYAECVITETKKNSFHKATHWKLITSRDACWDYIDPLNLITDSSGTAVLIKLQDTSSKLLDLSFVEQTLKKHFTPILHKTFLEKFLSIIYGKQISFYINGIQMEIDQTQEDEKWFYTFFRRRKNPIGFGYVRKSSEKLGEDERGIAISTYGKVIKRGWDWLGFLPVNPDKLTGIIELPGLAEILTTNKADFLKDVSSLNKYYRYRKAIQETLMPIFETLGEIPSKREELEKSLKPMEKEIEKIIQNILAEFPELTGLFGTKQKGEPQTGIIEDPLATPIGVPVEGTDIMSGTLGGSGEGSGIEAGSGNVPGEHIKPADDAKVPGSKHNGHRKRATVMLGFEDNENRKELGWLSENVLWINKAHPAYKRAVENNNDPYHIIISAAWVLSNYIEKDRSPQDFINHFLGVWGTQR